MEFYQYNINDFTADEYKYWYSVMRKDKQKRIDGYKKSDDRIRSVCAHMLAVKAMSQISGIAEKDIEIYEEESGKPYCSIENTFFSIGHCDELVVCAVSTKPIGVDIEKIRKINLAVAKKVCTKAELTYIFNKEMNDIDFSDEDPEILSRFFEIWVKKEAFGKKEGFGIGYKMSETDVSYIPHWRNGEYVIAVAE